MIAWNPLAKPTTLGTMQNTFGSTRPWSAVIEVTKKSVLVERGPSHSWLDHYNPRMQACASFL